MHKDFRVMFSDFHHGMNCKNLHNEKLYIVFAVGNKIHPKPFTKNRV